jgi:hypothetical protein
MVSFVFAACNSKRIRKMTLRRRTPQGRAGTCSLPDTAQMDKDSRCPPG